MTKALIISDIGGSKTLADDMETLYKNDVQFDMVISPGDLMGHDWAHKGLNAMNAGKEELTSKLKTLREYSDDVVYLPGNTDLNPNLTHDICRNLDITNITENVNDSLYGPHVKEGKGFSIVSWGPGAGKGGKLGYNLEIGLYNNHEFPESTIYQTKDTRAHRLNPTYSGILFGNMFQQKMENAKSSNRIVVSHVPMYMGNDISQISEPRSDNTGLDVVGYSKVEGVTYDKPEHVGDIFFRNLVNSHAKTASPVSKVFHGHIHEGKGTSMVGPTYVENVGKFSAEDYVIREL